MSNILAGLSMHGYALYVWSAYGLVFVGMGINLLSVFNKTKYIHCLIKPKV
jgi:heme exporter protein CcmD